MKHAKKVLTITLNPCIDRTIYFKSFKQGATNYVDNQTEEAAGKGINVAIALAHIGVPVKALGFSYKENAAYLYEKLDKEKVPYAFVELHGRMRVNQKLFDLSTREMTECNERGRPVSEKDVSQVLELLEKELQDASLLVLSGSVPPGIDKNIYARMIHMAHDKGVKTILDASGELMRLGCEEKPYLIKPNREEFVETFLTDKVFLQTDAFSEAKIPGVGAEYEQLRANGCCETASQFRNVEELMQETASSLIAFGITYVCISLGKEGVLLINESGAVKYPAKPADVQSLQGAGDAMVAGLCKAIYEDDEKNMAEYALLLAASTISLPGTCMGILE